MATDIKPAGYIPQGTFIIPQRNIERRQRLADVLAIQGMDTSPVQSPWQALARVAQSGVGAFGNIQANRMEQKRYKALGEAMRGGMSPEQMFATGDPQMMQLGEFMVEQQRLKLAQEQQNATLRIAQEELNLRKGQESPEARATAEHAAREADIKQRKAGDAARFISKARGIQSQFGSMQQVIDPVTKKPVMQWVPKEGASDMLGPWQAGTPGTIFGSALGTGSQGQRNAYESNTRGVAKDYATMQDPDRPDYEGARLNLPKLTETNDPQAMWQAWEDRINDAQRLVDEAGGVAYPGGAGVGSATGGPVPPPGAGPAQHPFQGAPGPGVNARAGEVPLPGPAMVTAPPQGGGYPMPTDPETRTKMSPETWAKMTPEDQLQWIQAGPQQ